MLERVLVAIFVYAVTLLGLGTMLVEPSIYAQLPEDQTDGVVWRPLAATDWRRATLPAGVPSAPIRVDSNTRFCVYPAPGDNNPLIYYRYVPSRRDWEYLRHLSLAHDNSIDMQQPHRQFFKLQAHETDVHVFIKTGLRYGQECGAPPTASSSPDASEPSTKTDNLSSILDSDSVWTGRGEQTSGSSWSIEIRFDDSSTPKISYPSLNCGGRLELEQKTGSFVRYRERLTYGEGRCIDNGYVVLTPENENSMEYDWFYSSGEHDADGLVRRE